MSLDKKNATSVMLENFMDVDKIKASTQSANGKTKATVKTIDSSIGEEPGKKKPGRKPVIEESVRFTVALPAELRKRAELTVMEMRYKDPDTEMKTLSDFVRIAIEEKLERMA